MPPIEVTIIIVSYNTEFLLKKCIESIYSKVKAKFEIIVVDNASKDGSVCMVKLLFPEVKCLENRDNKGFGAANNMAVSIAKGEYIFFLNSDTYLINEAVDILLNFVKESSNFKIGAVGGALYNEDMTNQISFGRFPGLYSTFFEFFLRQRFTNYYDNYISMAGYVKSQHPINVDYVTGADLLIKKETLLEVGIFDEDFFLFFEESELCFRIAKAGYKNYIIPGAKIIHLCGKSTEQTPSIQKIRWFEESRLNFFKKTRSMIYAKIFKVFISLLYRLGYLIKSNKEFWKARIMTIKNLHL